MLSSTRLSEYADIIKTIKPGNSPGWARPANWPRIDLIPMRNRTDDVMYFILEKPLVDYLTFQLRCNVLSGRWLMEQIDVSDDGLSVSSLTSTIQYANGNDDICFNFPVDDKPGTLYAVCVRPELSDQYLRYPQFTYKQSKQNVSYFSYFLRNRICKEAIIRIQSTKALEFAVGAEAVCGPLHIAYYDCYYPFTYGLRGLIGLQYAEFRGNSTYNIGYACPDLGSLPSTAIIDIDDSCRILFRRNVNMVRMAAPDRFGSIDWLNRAVDYDTNEKLNWSTVSACGIFSSNVLLNEITLPIGFGTSFSSISQQFNNCASLQCISLPYQYGLSATNMMYTFQNCNSLISIDLPNGCGSSVTNTYWMFRNCLTLTSISIPESFGERLSAAQGMFMGCCMLNDIYFPDNFGINLKNAQDMFSACFSISSIHFPKTFGNCLTTITNAFSRCNHLSVIDGDFNVSCNVDFQYCPLTHDSIMNVISSVQNVNDATTLRFGASNLAKITDDEKKIATDKGWTLA